MIQYMNYSVQVLFDWADLLPFQLYFINNLKTYPFFKNITANLEKYYLFLGYVAK